MASISSVNVGSAADDGTGDPLRTAFQKLNANDTALNTELAGKAESAHTHGTADLSDGAVTYAKIQNVGAASRLLGRGSAGGAGAAEEITLGTNLSMSGTTLNASGGAGSADWGNIGGTLSDQTDLQAALDAKADTSHTHSVADITEFSLSSPENNDVLAWDTAQGAVVYQNATEAGLLATGSLTGGTLTARVGSLNFSGGVEGDVLTVQADGSAAFEAAGAHTHTIDDITDAGALASLDTVATAQIDNQAVTLDKIIDQAGFTAGEFTNPTVTVSQEGIITAIASGSSGGGLSTVTDTNTAITIGDAVDGTHRRLTAASAITLTLDAQATTGTQVAVTPKGDGAVTAQVEAGATYTLPTDTAARTASFGVTGYVLFECVANSDGDSAEWDVVGETDHADTADNALDMNGEVVSGNLAKVETDSGALTAGQSGQIIVTSGNITIPTTTGFNVTLIAGGAHTVSFNGTTSAAMAAGDIMSIVVESATVVHAVLTAAADKVSFS